jgi:hypothetical protein
MPKYPTRVTMAEQATESRAGIARFSTPLEVLDSLNDKTFVSPKSLEQKIDNTLSQPGMLQFNDVTILAPAIKTLRATPVVLVPAQGAGSVVKLVGAQLKLVAGTNVLSETADNLAIRYLNTTGVLASQAIETTGFIDQAVNTYTTAEPKIDVIGAFTTVQNHALLLHNTGDGEFAGNAANDAQLVVRTYYLVHTI